MGLCRARASLGTGPSCPLPALCPCPSGLEHGRGHTHTHTQSCLRAPPIPTGCRGHSRSLHSPGFIHRLPLAQPLPSLWAGRAACRPSSFSTCSDTSVRSSRPHPSPRRDEIPPNQPCNAQGGGEPPAPEAQQFCLHEQLCSTSPALPFFIQGEAEPGFAEPQQKAPNWGILRAELREGLASLGFLVVA